jgi:dTDP-4-dehydrorhamnose reductase
MSGLRVLVTGGSGQVGTALRLSAPPDVEVSAPASDTLDVTRIDQVERHIRAFRPDVVINAAAYTAVDRAEDDRECAFEVNSQGARNVAQACAAIGCGLIHLSTDYVFDGHKPNAYSEADPPHPINVYGASKLAGERAVLDLNADSLVLRVSWVFASSGSNFVRTMLSRADRPELRIVDDQHGSPCAADDIASALWSIARRWSSASPKGLFHFASSPVVTWYGFADRIFAAARANGLIRAVPKLKPVSSREYVTRAVRPLNSVLDDTRLRAAYGLETPDWRIALDRVLSQLAA